MAIFAMFFSILAKNQTALSSLQRTFEDDVEAVLPLVGSAAMEFAEGVFEHVISTHVHRQVLATATDPVLRVQSLQFLRR